MLDEYIVELENDLKIDELNLKDYQLRLPAIKHKWVGRCIRKKLELSQLIKKLEDIKTTLITQIQADAPVKLSTGVISQKLDTHDIILKYKAQIEENKLIIELLEKTEKTFNSATFDIKNLVEIMKLELT